MVNNLAISVRDGGNDIRLPSVLVLVIRDVSHIVRPACTALGTCVASQWRATRETLRWRKMMHAACVWPLRSRGAVNFGCANANKQVTWNMPTGFGEGENHRDFASG